MGLAGDFAPRRPWSVAHLCRNHLYAGLAIVGLANGASERIAGSLAHDGAALALLNMFGLSLVVWLAAGAAAWLFLQSEEEAALKSDFIVAGAASIAFLLPIPQLSWLALTGLGCHIAFTSSGTMRRAAVVLAAITIPMFWARIVFALFSDPVLAIDARLVGWVVGTQSDGNAIPFVDGSGLFFLEPACSSLTNVSLALLCGVVIAKLYDLPWSAAMVRTVLVACLATVAINIVRLSSIGVLPEYYGVIHGPFGRSIAEWMTNFAVVAIYAGGLRSDAPAHH
jgi:exosortase/archaeosortase family protein